MNPFARLWKHADWELRFPVFIDKDASIRPIVEPSRFRIFVQALKLVLRKIAPDKTQLRAVLTFDDGPYEGATEPLLDALRSANVPATFFLVGRDAAANTAAVQAIADAGMEIASHSKTHPRLPTLTPREQLDEIDDGRRLVENAAGRPVTLFRPPHGAFDRTTLQMARQTGQTVSLWNINPADYDDISADTIVERVMEQKRNPAVILLHSDRPQTVVAISEIVRRYQELGYVFTTVGRLQGQAT